MNATRRKELNALQTKIEDLCQELVTLGDEEQECFDNLPESLQQAEKGQAMECAATAIAEASGYLSQALESLESAAS